MSRPSYEHEAPCWGGHDATVTCAIAEQTRAEEKRALFHCPESENGQHSFTGDTFCAHGCGRNIQELVPDAKVGEDE